MSPALPENRMFGAVERRLFRMTAVLFAIVALVGLIAGVIWVLGLVLSFFYNLVMPLSVAGILALTLNPVVDHLEQRTGASRAAATSIVVLLFMAAIIGSVIVIVPILIREVGLLVDMAPAFLARSQEYMTAYFPGITRMVLESAKDGELNELIPDLGDTGATVRSSAGVLIGLSIVPLILFFALLSGRRLHGKINEVLSVFSARTQEKIMYFVSVFLVQVTGFFQGQLVIAFIMGVMFAIGFTLIGLNGGILIGLALGLLNIVPFLGTLIGLLVVLPLAYFQPSGDLQMLGLSLLVFTAVQLAESWLLTPRIMADRSGLHPVLVVISVLFWGTAIGGITGMVLAVPLTAFLVAVWSQAKAGLALSMTSDHDADRIEIATGTLRPSRTDAS
ncbi:MAG: AI-2E family transporter [Pseudomonadales bacterium]